MKRKTNSSSGLSDNIASVLCYILMWISGIIMLVIEKESLIVRFHALQSILTFGALTVFILLLNIVKRIMPFFLIQTINTLTNIILIIAAFLWLALIINCYCGRCIRVPFIDSIIKIILNERSS